MDYKKVYDAIVEKRRNEVPIGYGERHHIVPRSLGGSDSPDNLVALTAREHFLCHWLLVKMCQPEDKSKMSSAFNAMCRNGNGQVRSSKHFDAARRVFSENHPCKNDSVKKKISDSLSTYYAGIPEDVRRKYERRSCAKCTNIFHVWPSDPQKYCGVSCSRASISTETKEKISRSLKDYVGKLSREQKQERMSAALNAPRGHLISAAKRGKKTNQRSIEVEKYGKMSDDEFADFLRGRNANIVSRMTNRRNEYKDLNHG